MESLESVGPLYYFDGWVVGELEVKANLASIEVEVEVCGSGFGVRDSGSGLRGQVEGSGCSFRLRVEGSGCSFRLRVEGWGPTQWVRVADKWMVVTKRPSPAVHIIHRRIRG